MTKTNKTYRQPTRELFIATAVLFVLLVGMVTWAVWPAHRYEPGDMDSIYQ